MKQNKMIRVGMSTLAGVGVLVGLVQGCGKDTPKAGPVVRQQPGVTGVDANPSPTAEPAVSPTPSASPTVTVTIQPGAMSRTTEAYTAGPLTVAPGTTVVWVNSDDALHSVTSNDGGVTFDSKLFASGESFSHLFDTSGTFDYHCTAHPRMVGTVVVTGAPGASPSPSATP